MTIDFTNLAQTFANIATIFGLFFLAWQVMIAVKVSKMELDQKKKDRALQYIARWNDIDFNKLRRGVLVRFRQISHENLTEELKQIEADTAMKGDTHFLLNYLEEVAIAINHGHTDFDISFLFFGPLCVQYFELINPYILRQREIKHDRSIWIEIEQYYHLVIKQQSQHYSVPPGRFWSN